LRVEQVGTLWHGVRHSRVSHREGIALAKKAGVYRGRKPFLTAEKADHLCNRVAAGEKKAGLAREFGISRETVYAYLNAHGAAKAQRQVAEGLRAAQMPRVICAQDTAGLPTGSLG
jgi:hypothetical protein